MPSIIYYDQNCHLCQRLKKWYDRVKRPQIQVEWRHVEDAPACDLAGHSCGQFMQVVTEEGKSYQGFYAVRILLGYTRFGLLKPLLYLPGAAWLGVRMYSWVANNRYRWGGRK